MKKTLCLLGLIVLSGCSSDSFKSDVVGSAEITGDSAQAVDETVIESTELPAPQLARPVLVEDTQPLLPATGSLIPKSLISNSQSWFTKTDCIALLGGENNNADLFVNLMSDRDSRSMMPLKKLTPVYVQSLQEKINKKTQEKWQANLQNFYVCHLAEGLDVVAGKLRKDNAPIIDENGNYKQILAVVFIEEVFTYDDLPIFNADKEPVSASVCEADFEDVYVRWSCKVKGEEGLISKSWLLPLNGEAAIEGN